MRRFCFQCLLFVLPIVVAAQIPAGYYNHAEGKKKAELKAVLKDIICNANVLNYGSGVGATWSGFYYTDRTEEGYCMDRYCDEWRQFNSSTEAVPGMNIEHSFAKSWWGGSKNQAYCDLFNLMPSDQTANSSKGNYAMGKVTSSSWTNGSIKVGKNERGIQVWEPADRWKGDFARTYMYMVTCYSHLTWQSAALTQLENNDWPVFNDWTQQLLMKWSRQDPVDEIEKKRNEAVYKIQGNRNPFVDYPNLCEYVWGDSIDYAFHVDGSSTEIPDVPDTPDIPDTPDTPDNPDVPDDTESFAEDFENGTKGAYAAATVECTACNWYMANALIGQDEKANGMWSVRIKSGGYIVMLEDSKSGCGSMSFYAGNFKADTGVRLTVSCSSDGGTTWIPVVTDLSFESGTWQRYDYEVHLSGNVRLKFECSGTDGKRVNVDDIRMTPYSVSDGLDSILVDDVGDNADVFDLAGRPVTRKGIKGVYVKRGKKILR